MPPPIPNKYWEITKNMTPLEKVKSFLARLFYIVKLVWKSSPAVLIVLAVLCLSDGVMPVLGAYISRGLLNEIAVLIGASASGSIWEDLFVTLSPLIFLFVLHIVYTFVHRVLGRINKMVTALAGELVVNHIKLTIMNKAKTIDQRSFDNPKFYEKLENANREAGMRPIGILSSTFSVISSLISVVSFIVVLATLSPVAPLLIIVASIPGAIVNYYYRNRNFQYMRRHSKERRRMNYYSGIITNKDMAKEVKLLGLGDTFTEKYNDSFGEYYKGIKRLVTKEGILQIIVSLIYVLASGALFVFVAYSVVFGAGQIGDYSLYTGALSSIATHVGTLVTATATIYEGTLFIENMIDFENEEVTVVPTINPPRRVARGAVHTIELKDVSFKYPGTENYVLKNINLTLKSGESVVLVGLNGAGKTTLIKLVTRLYDATEGVITLDGYDIREYDVKDLYDTYGIIFQDFGKYAETVRENISFGDVRGAHTEERISESAENSGADEYIEALPKKYETPLTRMFEEDGAELSGGQWQRLSVARAFYKDSDILIMDEPTASLDALAEQDVFSKFEILSKGKISIFVSHRLSSATTAGKIVVLEDGQISEMGTHSELMSLGGKYNYLFSTQAKRYIEKS